MVEQVAPGKNVPAVVGQLAAELEMHAPVAVMQQTPAGEQGAVTGQGELAVHVPLHPACTVWVQPPPTLQHAPRLPHGNGLQVIGLAYQMAGAAHWVAGPLKHPPVTGLQQTPGTVVLGQGLGWHVPPKYWAWMAAH